MKTVSLVFAFAALVTGLVAAWYWYLSSIVPVEPAWRVEPGDAEASQAGWIAAALKAMASAADLNKKAARWTAASAVCAAASSVCGAL